LFEAQTHDKRKQSLHHFTTPPLHQSPRQSSHQAFTCHMQLFHKFLRTRISPASISAQQQHKHRTGTMAKDKEFERYRNLLKAFGNAKVTVKSDMEAAKEELGNAPLIWWDVKQHMAHNNASLQQYALMGCEASEADALGPQPVMLNTNSPWSVFLCGSQGSGKSHALSCILENCLTKNDSIGKNPHPLAGLVFHYNRSQGSGVCEAAYLCSSIKTRVLVSASNYGRLKDQYEAMAKQVGGRVTVEALELHPSHLDTERIKMLMAVGKKGEMPLYMTVSAHKIAKVAS
jgi:DNA replication protein DnaC